MSAADVASLPSPSLGNRARRWLARHGLWLLVACSYLMVFPYTPGINNPNENVRLYMTRALVENHELAINKVQAEWGWVNDKSKNGARVFSSKAPGVSLLGVPVLAAQTWLWHRLRWTSPSKQAATLAVRLFAVMVPMCGFLWALDRYLRGLTAPAIANLLFVGIALGSLLYPYGIHFVGHGLAAAFSFGAFMALTPGGRLTTSARRIAVAGLLAGLGVVFEYQNILIAAVLAGWVAIRRPRLLHWLAVGALPGVAILMTIHARCYGSPWAFPYSHLENVEFQLHHHHRGFDGLSWPSGQALLGVLFLPGFGLFAGSPFLVFGVWATGWLIARGGPVRDEAVVAGAVSVALALFLAGMPNWHGGWSVGPRYIAAIVPFLAVALALAWPRFAAKSFGPTVAGALVGLVLVGVLVNASSAVLYPQYPPQFRNPTFQLLLRLPGQGYVPYSLWYGLGLRGVTSLVPSILVLAAAVAVALRSLRHLAFPKATHALATLAIVATLTTVATVGALALWPRHMNDAERSATTFVKSTWTPQPAAGRR